MRLLCYLPFIFLLTASAGIFPTEKGYMIEEYDKNGDVVKSYSFDSSNQLILWNEHFLSNGQQIRTDTYDPSNKLIRVTVYIGINLVVSLSPDGDFINKKTLGNPDKKPWIIAE